MPNFSEVLSKPVAQTEKPKPKPVGTYVSTLVGMPADKTVQVQGVERGILEFSVKMMAAHEGVDIDQLADAGDVGGWPPFKYSIWYDTPEGEYQLKSLLENVLGIDMSGNKTYGEAIAQTPGLQLLSTLKHRPYIDRTSGQAEIATDIGGVAKL